MSPNSVLRMFSHLRAIGTDHPGRSDIESSPWSGRTDGIILLYDKSARAVSQASYGAEQTARPTSPLLPLRGCQDLAEGSFGAVGMPCAQTTPTTSCF